jgi:IclR family acetate operon transcriptional repressor
VSSKSETAQTVKSALDFLEYIARHPGKTLSQLAQETGNTINRTHRLLHTLEAAGYLTKTGVKTYQLGPKLLILGRLLSRQEPLIKLATPIIEHLHHETGESVSLSIRLGFEHYVIAGKEGKHSLTFSLNRLNSTPIYLGAIGFCLLAYAPKEIQNQVFTLPLKELSQGRVKSYQELQNNLEKLKMDGLWISRDQQTGVFSAATPIYDKSFHALAALSIAGALTRFDRQLEAQCTHLLHEARVALHTTIEKTHSDLSG